MDKDKILSVLQKFRPLFSYVTDCPLKLLRDLAACLPTKYMVFPCDIIDLRIFLLKEKIFCSYPVPLFSQKFADKYLKSYSVFLIIDAKKISIGNYKYGGLQLNFAQELDISNLLYRIIVNEPSATGNFDIVKQMVEELGVKVECLVSNSIPGISSPSVRVLAQKKKAIKIAQTSELPLNSTEQQIFDFLRQMKKDMNLPIQMRVAGGWVRDKLLGIESDDIDIAVDVSGIEVAKAIEQYGRKVGAHVGTAFQVSLDKSAQPIQEEEKSNDLMVGGIDINGIKVEFVPMRTETYPDPTSRKPVITITKDPREDVKRRDLTINAMLYNIGTGKVEDYVGGIRDLGRDTGKVILRTPDDAKKTFIEDPLRILRVIRFNSRFAGSIVDDDIIKAMYDPEVHQAYSMKVAPERAGKEILKTMMADDPVKPLEMLFDSDLYKIVFNVPSMQDINKEGIKMEQKSPFHTDILLDHILKVVSNINEMMKNMGESDKMRGLLNIAALFHDFGKMSPAIQKPHSYKKVSDKPTGQDRVGKYVLDDGIKIYYDDELKTYYVGDDGQLHRRMSYIGHEDVSAKMVEEILSPMGEISKDEKGMIKQLVELHMEPHSKNPWTPKRIGRFLRRTKEHGKEESHADLWKYIFYLAQADASAGKTGEKNLQKYLDTMNKFENYLVAPESTTPPVIDGNVIISEIRNLYPGIKVGPWIAFAKTMIQEAQDEGNQIDVSSLTAQADARQYLLNTILPQLIELYPNYFGEENMIARNWFKKIVVAQAIPEGPVPERNIEVVKGPKEAIPPYQVGMRVRDRRKGVANPQEYGKVKVIKDNKMKVVWNPDNKKKKREEIFDIIKDLEALSLIVAEV